MNRLLSRLAMRLRLPRDAKDNPSHADTAETVNISALALLKMMRHAREGVPLEVMGLMLGNFVDDYTINIVDVFAMPQSGTSVTVESVDPIYQMKHMNLLKQTGRSEMVVGWYHSHPGFGCWLSTVDVSTQQSFEALHPRAIAVVIDPIQSVKGKVMLDAFRSINLLNVSSHGIAPTSEPRQTTSNIGNITKSDLVSTLHGLGIKYYSMNVSYKLSQREQEMMLCLNKTSWIDGISLPKFSNCSNENSKHIKSICRFLSDFNKDIQSDKESTNERQIENCRNIKRKLEQASNTLLRNNIVQQMSSVINIHALR